MVRFGVQSDEHGWAVWRLLRPTVEEVSVYLGLDDVMSAATGEKLSFTKINNYSRLLDMRHSFFPRDAVG